MKRKDFIALVLHATEDTICMLEAALRDDFNLSQHTFDRDLDPAARTVLHAADQLAFALVRYRAENQIPQR
jgi:hypothetical protein